MNNNEAQKTINNRTYDLIELVSSLSIEYGTVRRAFALNDHVRALLFDHEIVRRGVIGMGLKCQSSKELFGVDVDISMLCNNNFSLRLH
jgi:hypothetical protein